MTTPEGSNQRASPGSNEEPVDLDSYMDPEEVTTAQEAASKSGNGKKQKNYGLEKYDPNPGRDDVRKRIAYWLLAIISGIVLVTFVLLAFHQALNLQLADIRSILELVFTPTVTLLGAVTGFYYATHKDEN